MEASQNQAAKSLTKAYIKFFVMLIAYIGLLVSFAI
jgi:hypothetical protein